jgi:hypothetical protein
MFLVFILAAVTAFVVYFQAKKLGFTERLFVAFIVFIVAGLFGIAILKIDTIFRNTPPQKLSIVPNESPSAEPAPLESEILPAPNAPDIFPSAPPP